MRPLYLITPGVQQRPRIRSLIADVIAACGRSIWAVQIREQVEPGFEATDEEVVRLAKDLLPLCHKHGIKVIINSRPDLALQAGADGVHCGKRYCSLVDARSVMGEGKLIGYSAHSSAEAQTAAEDGASYLFLSPIYKSTSKQQYDRALGLEPLTDLCLKVKIPVFALGGINDRNAGSCAQAGASGIAMIGSVFFAESPEKAAQRIVEAWNAAYKAESVACSGAPPED